MGRRSKRYREMARKDELKETQTIANAIELLKRCPPVKFDQSVEIALMLGVDPRKSDQQVRGTVSLPNGTGKSLRVLVFAKDEKAAEALSAGAEFAGAEELLARVQGGWTEFDAVIATPDLMREVGKLGKVLGPRGLMPTPKAGTVTNDVAKAVSEIKAGKVEFKVDKNSGIHGSVGKLSFESPKLVENVQAFIHAVLRAKPASAKGQYVVSFYLSSTMGPGVKVDLKELPVV